MATHTPGPWTVRPNPGPGVVSEHGGAPFTVDAGGLLIARLGQQIESESEANARLIATAPDLLSAAKDFVEAFGSGEFDDPFKVVPYVDRFNAAIAKAQRTNP